MHKRRRWLFAGVGCVIVLVLALLVFLHVLPLNAPFAARYAVRGVDVSHYQGDIDWPVLAEGQQFAFIKATEGSSSVDEQFARNWAGASSTDLLVGAYHFFSFDSAGETQADNYIAAVGPLEGKLPPVVDIELYGSHMGNPPTREAARVILDPLLHKLEAQYGVKPILYATGASYDRYLKGGYEAYPLWIRAVYFLPIMDWAFWQYSDYARLDGYDGDEPCIDLNVFNGTKQALDELVIHN